MNPLNKLNFIFSSRGIELILILTNSSSIFWDEQVQQQQKIATPRI